MELLGKHPSKTSSIELPFVLRLDNLLRYCQHTYYIYIYFFT